MSKDECVTKKKGDVMLESCFERITYEETVLIGYNEREFSMYK